jgi:hypothetical protein
MATDGEVTWPSHSGGVSLKYGILHISDVTNGTMESNGFIRYDHDGVAWNQWLGAEKQKVTFEDPEKISYTVSGNGAIDGQPYSTKYKTTLELSGDTLTLTRDGGKVSNETATFKRAEVDLGASNPLAGVWSGVSGKSEFVRAHENRTLKVGKIIIAPSIDSAGNENNAEVCLAGHVRMGKGQREGRRIFFKESIFRRFDADGPKTVKWSEEDINEDRGKREKVKSYYSITLNDDGTMTFTRSDKFWNATVTLKKELW